MVRNAGKMLNVMMTRGVPPALGDVIQGSVIFARVRCEPATADSACRTQLAICPVPPPH